MENVIYFISSLTPSTVDKEQTHTIGVEFGAKIVKVAEKDIKLQMYKSNQIY